MELVSANRNRSRGLNKTGLTLQESARRPSPEAHAVLLKQRGELTIGTIVFGGLGALLMVLSLVGSLYPLPTYPLNLLPIIFIVYMVAGALWFFVLRQMNPASLLHIEHDLEIADIPAGAKVL